MKKRYFKIGKKVYSHRSVIQLIDLHSEISEDPEQIIRSLVQDKLTEARKVLWKGPPFNPETLASIMGIQCEASEELTHGDDAELFPAENGRMVIRYNPDKPKTRRHFSIAHEIAHTFFPRYKDQRSARHQVGKFDPENEVEFLCDLAASQIVMPTPEFDLDVKSRGVSLKSLQELSQLYEVSLEAAANRIVPMDIQPCALVVLGYSHKPTEKSEIERLEYQQSLFSGYDLELPPMKLRVQYSVHSKRFSAYVPKHKSIDESCPLYQVSVSRNPFHGNAILNFTQPVLDTYIEAMVLPHTHNRESGSRVLVILFLV